MDSPSKSQINNTVIPQRGMIDDLMNFNNIY